MQQRAADLQRRLKQSLLTHGVPGASVAVLQDEQLIAVSEGVANTTTGIGMTPDTIMLIGSITKLFTATLVMQLVEEGQLSLDDPVAQHLPEFKLKELSTLEEVTVRMLLNHTSGIDGELLPPKDHDEETIEKTVGRLGGAGQLFRPGTEFSYCNAGTVIAGYLAQRLRGKSWYRLIRERIFEPLQLAHAATLPEEALLQRVAIGHYVDPATRKARRTSQAFLSLGFAPCGTTLMMSAADLVRFATVHMDSPTSDSGPQLLSRRSAKTMQEMTVRHVGKGYTYADGMGLGWMVFSSGMLHHGGGGPGIASALYVHPAERWALAILANADYGASLSFINELAEPWLLKFNVKPYGAVDLHELSTPLAVDRECCAGVYQDILHRYEVTYSNGALTLSRQLTFAPYENMSTEPSAGIALAQLTDGRFWEGGPEVDLRRDGFNRVFTFRSPVADGRMQYLGNGMRLYRRVN